MTPSIHAAESAASADVLPSTCGLTDPHLGFAALADARVSAHLLEQEVGHAACKLALDTVHAQLLKHRDRVEALATRPDEATRERLLAALRTAFTKASVEVDALARRRDAWIRVTLDVALVSGGECVVAHVGDGRVTLSRQGLLHLLTRDHVEDEQTPLANQLPALTRGLGSDGVPEPETLNLTLSAGDRLWLLSPSLHRNLDDLSLRETSEDLVPDGAAARILGLARGYGARTDLAVVVLDVGPRRAEPGVSRLETLAHIPLFAYCTERELLAIAGLTRPARYAAGQAVFQEREHGQSMYLVVSGRLSVRKADQELSPLTRGAFFGEMAMLDQPRRSATVRAVEDSELLVITRDAFFGLLKRDPTLAVKVLWNMLRHVSARLRVTSEQLARATATPPPSSTA